MKIGLNIKYNPLYGVLEFSPLSVGHKEKLTFNKIKDELNHKRQKLNELYSLHVPFEASKYNTENPDKTNDENGECIDSSSPFSDTDSIFDHISGGFAQAVLKPMITTYKNSPNQGGIMETTTFNMPDGGQAFYTVNINNPSIPLFQLNIHRSVLPVTSILSPDGQSIISNQTLTLADFFHFNTNTAKYELKQGAPSLVDKCLVKQLEEALKSLGY